MPHASHLAGRNRFDPLSGRKRDAPRGAVRAVAPEPRGARAPAAPAEHVARRRHGERVFAASGDADDAPANARHRARHACCSPSAVVAADPGDRPPELAGRVGRARRPQQRARVAVVAVAARPRAPVARGGDPKHVAGGDRDDAIAAAVSAAVTAKADAARCRKLGARRQRAAGRARVEAENEERAALRDDLRAVAARGDADGAGACGGTRSFGRRMGWG